MAMTDPLGDMLTRIRNGQMRRKSVVNVPASNMRGRVLDVLKSEGFIKAFNSVAKDINNNANEKGFWEGEWNPAETISLIHAELSEALEGFREGNYDI